MTNSADGPPSNYRFADLTLDVGRRSLARDGQAIELKALDFDLLRFLVESAPNVVNADVLAEKVWGRHFVSPENVAQRVMLLRQSLGDDANKPRYIETVRNRGYRLVPVVERATAREEPQAGSQPRKLKWVAAVLLVGAGLTAAAWYRVAGAPDGQPTPSPGSVAVLPFENLSPADDDAFFAAGMQDEIVSQLTKIAGLRVIPVRPAAGALPVEHLARTVDAATTLGGSVYYSEGRVRVTPRLTEASTGVSLWSKSYERELSNIFAIQGEIALDVAYALRVELSASERRRIERVPTVDPRARDLYLRARAREWRDTADEVLRAIGEIEQALEIDPTFAEAWVADSGMRVVAQYYEPQNTAEHQARGEEAARRALQLDPELGNAHAALGFALAVQKDWKGAEAAYRSARNFNAPLADMPSYSILQLSVGNFAFARQILEETRGIAPQNATSHRFLMVANAALDDWSAATELYESGVRVFVPWREAPTQWLHWLIGRRDFAAARAVPIDDPFNAAMLASLDAPEQALAELRRAHAAAGIGNPYHRRDIGLWAAHFGDSALALDAMRLAIDEQGGHMVYVWFPQFAPVRRLPEFEAYVREIGLVAYWQEYGWPSACRPIGANGFECG